MNIIKQLHRLVPGKMFYERKYGNKLELSFVSQKVIEIAFRHVIADLFGKGHLLRAYVHTCDISITSLLQIIQKHARTAGNIKASGIPVFRQ